jgi:hypothetical protein
LPVRVVSVLVGLAVFSAGAAFAASMSWNTRSLASGNTTVATCTGALRATYSVAWDATAKTYKLATVTVSGNTSSCAVGAVLSADVFDSSNTSLYHFEHPLVSGDIGASAAIVLTPSSTVAIGSVKGIAAGVTG